ncbi:ATP-dependent helicase [Altericista sp. CCNU0014]|uniref:ATP-dependent helicase n=1 Tax=Altericista sp. CCNU0014 TaxID=3082949 RepID=UPI00384EBD2B
MATDRDPYRHDLSSSMIALTQQLEQLRQSLRPGQREMAEWKGGPLAVSAVPGAGKSHGMAAAAAIAIARFNLGRAQQLVLVTFTRSAAANLKQKVRLFLKELDLPQTGFTVQTLHSLALNIASRYPQQSGLDLANATLISPYQSHRLVRQCVEQWIQAQPHLFRLLLEVGSSGEEGERLRRQSALRSDILPALAHTAIHEAKSSGLTSEDLAVLSSQASDELPILAIASGLYQQYDALLQLSGWIDYDDMILGALRALKTPQILAELQQEIFAVFEDEAQDSTPLQSKLLESLAVHPDRPSQFNLIRVGDPNQAINSTFTPADPIYFRWFCEEQARAGRLGEMAQSARSCQPIIDAANFMLTWANQSPLASADLLPFKVQAIHPVPPSDDATLTNPLPLGRGVELYFPADIYRTADAIGQRAADVLTQNPDLRIAVLVRENKQARFLAAVFSDPKRYGLSVDLAERDIPVYDVGAEERRSNVPNEMLAMLQFLARPHSTEYFKVALTTLAKRQIVPTYDFNQIANEPEQFLYPGPLASEQSDERLLQIRSVCTTLLTARWELPLYQLISFLALELHYDAAELATADKLASRLQQQMNAERSTLATAIAILQEIVSTERFEAVDLDNDDSHYTRARQLTLITMHKAKGLDWDVVFLPFLHDSVIPGSLRVPGTAQFLGDYAIAEVARTQIRANLHGSSALPSAREAWHQAKTLKVAEEFRLLYVAMTRAKRLLWLSAAQMAPYSWGSFNWERQPQLERQNPCPIVPALKQRFPAIVVPIHRK